MKQLPLWYAAPKEIQADYQKGSEIQGGEKREPGYFNFYLKQRKPGLPPCIYDHNATSNMLYFGFFCYLLSVSILLKKREKKKANKNSGRNHHMAVIKYPECDITDVFDELS